MDSASSGFFPALGPSGFGRPVPIRAPQSEAVGEEGGVGGGRVFSFRKNNLFSFFPNFASSEPTRGWLAPGYNYWLLLVGACRAESRAATRPCSLLRFLVKIKISPSIPWRGGQCFSWTPAQRVPQWEQKPTASSRGVVLLQPQLREDAPEQSKDLHGCRVTLFSSHPFPGAVLQSPGDDSQGVMKKQGQGCRRYLTVPSASVKCHTLLPEAKTGNRAGTGEAKLGPLKARGAACLWWCLVI